MARRLLKSIAIQATPAFTYTVHVFSDNSTLFNDTFRGYWAQRLDLLAASGVSLQHHSIPAGDPLLHAFKQCASMRLWLPDLLPDVKAVAYVDSDTLFFEDPSGLWSLFCEFGSNQYLAAKMLPEGSYYQKRPTFSDFLFPAGVNSGVLLMDLEHMRRVKTAQRLRHMLTHRRDEFPLGDQDAINAYLNASPAAYFPLPCRFNVDAESVGVCLTTGRKLGLRHGKANAFSNKLLFHSFALTIDGLWPDADDESGFLPPLFGVGMNA